MYVPDSFNSANIAQHLRDLGHMLYHVHRIGNAARLPTTTVGVTMNGKVMIMNRYTLSVPSHHSLGPISSPTLLDVWFLTHHTTNILTVLPG